jgi:hypothetical protein
VYLAASFCVSESDANSTTLLAMAGTVLLAVNDWLDRRDDAVTLFWVEVAD